MASRKRKPGSSNRSSIIKRLAPVAMDRASPVLREEFERPIFAWVRRFCLALSEAIEKLACRHPTFRASKKMFCAFEMFGGRPSVAFRLTPAEAARFSLKRHFFATPYGRSVWVSRWVDVSVDPKVMATLIDRSYR
jgi:predicted DNA-binding protein (MmcQ/YjbR family)